MKHILLFFLLISVPAFLPAQSLGERLAVNSPKMEEKSTITIYPNPATTHIGLSSSKGVDRVLIFNMVGRQMKNYPVGVSDKQYFVGDLPRGIYLVQLLGSNNEVITTKRVSKR